MSGLLFRTVLFFLNALMLKLNINFSSQVQIFSRIHNFSDHLNPYINVLVKGPTFQSMVQYFRPRYIVPVNFVGPVKMRRPSP